MSTRIEIKAECASSINLLIQNCCDPLIQEVITFNTPGLPPIGAYVDDEGNCWSLLGTTTDPVNSVRRVAEPYGSCETCLASNPCPTNLVVDSCCANFDTIFSGSLPGVGVGDSFSDTFGFCWTVTGTTPAPINGVVSVGTAYPVQDCTTCLGDNICPDIYVIRSCCKDLCNSAYFDLYTTLEQLGGGTPGETFVDQFGFCWTIGLLPVPVENFTLLTGSFIQYVSSSNTDCFTCITENNACTVNVFYTIQNCLTLETEVVQWAFGLQVNYSFLISFTTVLNPRCYKIISWDNTSLPTRIIDAVEDCFIDCNSCLNGGAGTAPYLITAPTLSDYTICGIPGNMVTIQSMVLGGDPVPTLTYNWQGIFGESSVVDFGQYTNTFYVDYSLIGFEYWCTITATNSAGVLVIQTPSGLVSDCS